MEKRWTPLKEYPMRWKMRFSLASLFLPISLPLPLSLSLDSNDRPVRLLSFLPPAIPRIPESQSFERRKERKEWRERERDRELLSEDAVTA